VTQVTIEKLSAFWMYLLSLDKNAANSGTNQTENAMNTNTTSSKSANTSAVRRTARILAGAMFATTALTAATTIFSGSAAQALPLPCPGPLCVPIVPVLDPALIDIIFPVLPTKNVKVTINDGRTAVALNDNPIYTITVRNLWSSPANGVSVLNNVPAGLSGLVWSCSPGVGSACGAPNGSGSINQIVNLGPQSYVAFTTSSLVNSAGLSISNSVTVIPPAAFGDNNAVDNSAVDLDTVTPPATTTTAPAPTTTTTTITAPAPAPTTTVAAAPVPTTTAAPVTLPPPVIVNPTTTTVAPAPTTTQAPTPTQPQTIVVIVKQEGPTATVAPAKKAVAKKKVAKKKVAKKTIVAKKK
jgi:Domain of unknown function DUF11